MDGEIKRQKHYIQLFLLIILTSVSFALVSRHHINTVFFSIISGSEKKITLSFLEPYQQFEKLALEKRIIKKDVRNIAFVSEEMTINRYKNQSRTQKVAQKRIERQIQRKVKTTRISKKLTKQEREELDGLLLADAREEKKEEAVLIEKPVRMVSAAPERNGDTAEERKLAFIEGTLGSEAEMFLGHFEVGLYQSIDILGRPVGAPISKVMVTPPELTFALPVLDGARGYLFARYEGRNKRKETTEWSGYAREQIFYDENMPFVVIPIEKTSPFGIAATRKEYNVIRGKVRATFVENGGLLPVTGAKIRLRGTEEETYSHGDGSFSLNVPKTKGRVLLEILKPGYLPRIKEFVVGGKEEAVELVSRNALASLAETLRLSVSETKSALILESKSVDGQGLPGIRFDLSLNAQGPFYFSADGTPDKSLTATTFDGRAIYFDVEPGVGFVKSSVLGKEVAAFVVSNIDENELLYEEVSIRKGKVSGRLFDPINKKDSAPSPIPLAQVRIEGSSEWTESDAFGAFELPNIFFVENKEILIEVNAKGYYKHRYTLKIPRKNDKNEKILNQNLYAFSLQYINDLATAVGINLNPNRGLLMGKVNNKEKIRIDALSESTNYNESKDYYFNKSQLIQGAHSYTEPKHGTYAIFDMPPGRVLLQGVNSAGKLRYSEIGYFSPSTVNVILGN